MIFQHESAGYLGSGRIVANPDTTPVLGSLPDRRLSGQGASIDTTKPAGKLVFGILAAWLSSNVNSSPNAPRLDLSSLRARSRKGGDRYKMTAAKLRLAMASMGKTADHGRHPMP